MKATIIKCTLCGSENVSVGSLYQEDLQTKVKTELNILDCHCKDCEWDFVTVDRERM